MSDQPHDSERDEGRPVGEWSGVVIAFDAHVGLGSIRTDEGQDVMFHCAEILDGTRMIEVGRRVRYRLGHKFDRPEAFDIASI